jgi:hypothetical protein
MLYKRLLLNIPAKELRFAPDDAAVEELMRLFAYMQVKFWLE